MYRFINTYMNMGNARKFYNMKRREYNLIGLVCAASCSFFFLKERCKCATPCTSYLLISIECRNTLY